MWVGVLATAVNVMAGDHYFPLALRMLATVIGAGTAAVYLVGAYRNQRDVNSAMLHKIRIYVAILVFMPLMGVIENAAVVWALLKPVKGFDVVDKN